MPWIAKPHACRLPRSGFHRAVGSLWRCRKCDRVWEIEAHTYNPSRNSDTVHWATIPRSSVPPKEPPFIFLVLQDWSDDILNAFDNAVRAIRRRWERTIVRTDAPKSEEAKEPRHV